MNQDEHQRERMRAWVAFAPTTNIEQVDWLLAEFDKRFPAPVEPIPVPDQSVMGRAVAGMIMSQEAELASLREKARMWDAVGSGKVVLSNNGTTFYATWTVKPGYASTLHFTTAEEAVQAAIDAGALK